MTVLAVPSPRSTLAHPIDVVWSCSPGPGLSRARRGTGVPGERVCSSRSVRGAPRLTFSPWPSGRGRKAGAGLRPLALTFGLLSPASGGVSGGRGSSDTADALASPSRRVLRERPSPRWGGLYRCCAVPPRVGARACLVGSSVVLLERSRSSLRCLRPSGGVVSLNPGVLLGSPPRWCVCVP